MNFRKLLFFILSAGIIVSLSFSNVFSPDKDLIKFPKGEKYKREWAKVDSLDGLGLPKSALEIVNKIYNQASKANNPDQTIKALMYKMKYLNIVEEDAFEGAVKQLEEDVLTSKFPNNAMMHSMLAEMYWMYYQNNRWKFYDRTQTVNFVTDDIKTWDLNKLADQVIKHYMYSLENKDSLQRTSVEVYDEVIFEYETTKKYRPTLYDFLANRAITFFQNKELSLTRPADKFTLRENFYFSEAGEFVKENIKTSDTLSLQFYGIKTMQELLAFRLKSTNIPALIYADLKRLEFVKSNSVNDIKDSLYFLALLNLEKKYIHEQTVAEVSYLIANYYNTLAAKYVPANEEARKYKMYYKKAHEKCIQTIEKFPESNGAIKCKNLKASIETKSLSATVEEVIIPNSTFAVQVNYRNTNKAYIRIAQISREKYDKAAEKLWGTKLLDRLLKDSSPVKEYTFDLPDDMDHHNHSTEVLLDGLPADHYIVFIANNDKFSYKNNMVAYDLFDVSNISYFSRQLHEGTYEFYVNDRTTGHPLEGVTAIQWKSKYDYVSRKYKMHKIGTYSSDENGHIQTKAEKDRYSSYFMEFINGNDKLYSGNSFYSYNYNNKRDSYYSTTIFTDRAIYRPGQTVYFKGITLRINGEQKEIAVEHPVTVIFYDVNYQKVTELDLVTNEYGTFSGTIDIPTGLLNGQMQIYTSEGSKYISVEEYKRPKFEVEMLPFDGNYMLNDTVEVKGNAISFAGAYLTDAEISYRVVRTPVWRGWWSWYYSYNTSETEISNGKTMTDDDGAYEIKFKALPDLSMKKSKFLDFNYTIYVDVTDLNGETQSTQKSITVGYTALKLNLDIPSTVNQSSDQEFEISTLNLNNEFVPAKGKITISQLDDIDTPLRDRRWGIPDKFMYSEKEWNTNYPGNKFKDEGNERKLKKIKEVFANNFDTELGQKLKISNIKNWKVGRYKIEMESKDAFGNEIEYESYFTVFNDFGKEVPYNTIDWYSPIKIKGEPGDKAVFLIGSAEENIKVLYEIEHKGKIISKEWLDIVKEQKKIEIDIKEIYRGNFTVHFTFVRNNRYYTHSETVVVPYSNKELDIEFETFRNKLYPGEKEEWRIIIKGPKGEKVAAEMVAALYDASLDQFKANYWSFNIWNSSYSSLYLNAGMYSTSSTTLYKEGLDPYYPIPSDYTEYLNWFGFNYYGGYYYSFETVSTSKSRNGKGRGVMKSVAPRNGEGEYAMDDTAEVVEEMDELKEATTIASPSFDLVPGKDGERIDGLVAGNKLEQKTDEGLKDVKARSNFNETAFFYPHLETNEAGNIIVSFTVPESLTKWKMMGFAHTKNLEYGSITNELVTQKELMVMPNYPRFFRENDIIEFPVKISNLAENEVEGKIQLELFDALTMKPIDNIFMKGEKMVQTFKAKSKGNAIVTWKLKIPEGVQAIDYKVVAKAGKFSDGEERVLPVLTNRMLVTETMPLPIRGMQTKTFKFEKLINSGKSKTLRHQRYTLEFTSNPAWYAVQALPYLMEYPYECAEQVFSRYYANSLASHIANSSPKIKKVFDAWKNTPGSESLLSNLEKNQELKSVLLEETPWVLNAQSETERKKRIGLLFDLNKMSDELNRAIKKLNKMQSANGGWPWFKGMPESRYITQHIVTGMGHLDNLGVKNVREDKDVWKMVSRGVNYLDVRIKEDYEYLKRHYTAKEMEDKHIGYVQIQYMYARSYFRDIKIPKKYEEAFEYYKGQATKYWLSESKYMQGMIALALHRYKTEKVPQDIVKSLKERAIVEEEMGMYWKDIVGYYWYQAPIERQALLIEVFDEVANDQKAVDDLKVWLLKQKQTQDWKTTKATVEAVYALLLRGANWLESDQLVEIKVGDQVIDPKKMDDVKVEAGTGYFKTAWNGGEIKPEMGNVTVSKKDKGVAWGAVYWQYFEQLDKITPHETPLKLKKKLFIERNTDSGKVIDPVSDKSKLKVGDKVIVRIELRVDRSMEYVHMKDMRASGFEPINIISKYKYQGGLGYYESTKDAATNFFISYMPKGTYVFEYPLRVQHKGDFSNGITTIQCMYAPEFASHSEGIRVTVE